MCKATEKDEYEFCHQLLIENIAILEKTEVYATGAVAVTIAFSLSTNDSDLAKASSLIPILVAVVGTIRWLGLDGVIGRINDYLVILGGHLPEGGWTEYYRKHKPLALKRSRWTIWVILLAVSVLFAAFTWSIRALPERGSARLSAASVPR